jgi:N utilization substance protein B
MLNRRFLRIKALQTLYALSREEQPNVALYRKNLFEGLDKTYELFVFVLSFPEAFLDFLESELEGQKAKYIPAPEQIELLERILANKVLVQIANDLMLKDAQKKLKVNWSQSADLLRGFWNEIKDKNWVANYASNKENTYAHDKDFTTTLFEIVFADEDVFFTYLEERYLNWDDDQVLILTTLQRLLKDLKPTQMGFLPQKHKDEEEDLKFLKDLFDRYIQDEAEITDLITARTKNWDEDRIALVDMILMKMALCELLYFPYIPVKVSINEYLELAKLYSTPQSHSFINGILDKTQSELKKLNKIEKLGRGLVD